MIFHGSFFKKSILGATLYTMAIILGHPTAMTTTTMVEDAPMWTLAGVSTVKYSIQYVVVGM